MFDVHDLLAGLALEPTGDGRFRMPTMDYYGSSSGGAAASAVSDVIAGGQLLAQALVAAVATQPGKTAKSVHAVFARAGRVSQELEVQVATVQDGRTTGAAVVTFVQQGRPFATATVLLHVPDPDVIRHGSDMPTLPGPDDPGTRHSDRGLFEAAFVAGSELVTPDDVAPANQPMWVRFPDAPSDETEQQALLAFVTNFQLVGIAMRPHVGLSQEQSHLAVSTGVLTHTVSFHEPFDATGWLLLDQEAPYSGRGRFYGRGDVFTADGALVASFAQDGLIRALGGGSGGGTSL